MLEARVSSYLTLFKLSGILLDLLVPARTDTLVDERTFSCDNVLLLAAAARVGRPSPLFLLSRIGT